MSLGCLLLLGVAYLLAKTTVHERWAMMVTSTHTRLFSKENLFEERIDPKDLRLWYQVVYGVKSYVEKKAGKDKDLLGPLALTIVTNNKFMNALKLIYNLHFSKSGLVGGSELDRLNNLLQLKEIEQKFKNSQIALERTRFFFRGKKDARDLLRQLAMTLEVTTTKAINDFSKEIKKRMSQ